MEQYSNKSDLNLVNDISGFDYDENTKDCILKKVSSNPEFSSKKITLVDSDDLDHYECEMPRDGGWSEWSKCSKECNGEQTRTCTRPEPLNGGRPCLGESSQPCNISPCLKERNCVYKRDR